MFFTWSVFGTFVEKWRLPPHFQQYWKYITLNHNYKKKNKIISEFLWTSGSLKHNGFVWKIFIHSNEVHIRDVLGIIPYNFFSDIYWKKPNLPGRHGLRKATGRTYLCSALAGTITWRTIRDKSRIFLKTKTCFFNLNAVYYGNASYLLTINFGGFEKHKLLNCLL